MLLAFFNLNFLTFIDSRRYFNKFNFYVHRNRALILYPKDNKRTVFYLLLSTKFKKETFYV